MEYTVHIRMNEHLFLRDPEGSELGRRIVRQSILLFDEIGFEEATFKKLAERLNTKEASIYRYFENKHRLLIYLVTWYWQWLDFQLTYQLHNLADPYEKLERLLRLLLLADENELLGDAIDIRALHNLVIHEASKVYLTHHVSEDNGQQLFKPYKDLCQHMATIILEYRPDYAYARSLATTLIETIHSQSFFMEKLPSLTNFGNEPTNQPQPTNPLLTYMRHLVFSILGSPSNYVK